MKSIKMNRVYDVEDLNKLVQKVPTEYQEDVRIVSFNMMKHEAYSNPE